ncbi:MAG: hypothetical protein AAF363_14470 [Bacteroidota bacterium]
MKKLFAILFVCGLLFGACSTEEEVVPSVSPADAPSESNVTGNGNGGGTNPPAGG